MFNLTDLQLGAEYQPLVNPHTQAIYGYEALSRFYQQDGSCIAPNIVFEQLHAHHEQLSQVELLAKTFQFQHAPQTGVLFVNIDPHAIEHNTPAMLALLQQKKNVCVEIIENTCINDAHLASTLIEQLVKFDIPVGLDDIGAPHSMLSVDLLSQVSCLKFDKYWLETAQQPIYHHLINALLDFAKKTNKLTVLEGIETEEHLLFAQQIGVDLVQGFLFKPLFYQPKYRVKLNNI
ncbi:EAL domain-containing protein [Shewanella youngdeokensis]|uniref:EAL domain-containing protein n=1 Tax=Shewanella youngdeokensis TaxID=2999068 RepID=A0ABZ0JUB1_9GAMM|nr:EAL domain-containing protein [Shewanella sp. DAU334]